MIIKPNDEGIEYYKYQSSRYRFLLIGAIVMLLFIFQNSLSESIIFEITPSFLVPIILLFICIFISSAAYFTLTRTVADLLFQKATKDQTGLKVDKFIKRDKILFWVAYQSFFLGIVLMILQFTHYWLLEKTSWYAGVVAIFPWVVVN